MVCMVEKYFQLILAKLHANQKSLRVPIAWRTSASERLLDACGSFLVGRFKTVQQPVGTAFQKLGKACERRYGKRKIAVLNRANGLHMDARQLRKTLLRQTGVEAGLTDVPPKHTQDFAVVHSLK